MKSLVTLEVLKIYRGWKVSTSQAVITVKKHSCTNHLAPYLFSVGYIHWTECGMGSRVPVTDLQETQSKREFQGLSISNYIQLQIQVCLILHEENYSIIKDVFVL